ncbi:MAG: DUF721 domain-containing protein [Bacteroidia bacterium]|nr:DUF721 domain-containing protein [Bacteroidales bacterium]NCD40646.1 DUF721 domain-containing protein [Bacteroidia bacterium]
MRLNRNTYNIKETIELLMKTYKIDKKFDQAQVIKAYGEVVGPMISKHTTAVYMKEETLYIHVDNAALRNELVYAKERLIAAINKKTGKDLVINLFIS